MTVTMDIFQVDVFLEINVLFSTIVAGPAVIGHCLRVCCEATQPIFFMVFIDYLGKDFGLTTGKLRELDITFFPVPFKLSKCDGTSSRYFL